MTFYTAIQGRQQQLDNTVKNMFPMFREWLMQEVLYQLKTYTEPSHCHVIRVDLPSHYCRLSFDVLQQWMDRLNATEKNLTFSCYIQTQYYPGSTGDNITGIYYVEDPFFGAANRPNIMYIEICQK